MGIFTLFFGAGRDNEHDVKQQLQPQISSDNSDISTSEKSVAGAVSDNDSPIEEVRAAVLPTDDPSLPSLTFRSVFLGLVFTLVLSFINQFFWFRAQPLTVGILVVQLVSFPVGKFLARVLPDKRVGYGRFSFSLNP
ncbi:hypothetical protein GGI05_006344, partial [Coemansia sp. RSA 2603]